jgi:hypothetical protein
MVNLEVTIVRLLHVAVEIGDLHQFSNEFSYQFDVLSFVMIGLYIFAIIRYKSRKLINYCRNKFKIVLKYFRNVRFHLNLVVLEEKKVPFLPKITELKLRNFT